MPAARSQQRFHRGADILELPELLYGRELNEQDIADALGRDPRHVRSELFHLTFTGQLKKTCGVGRRPAYYSLPGTAENQE